MPTPLLRLSGLRRPRSNWLGWSVHVFIVKLIAVLLPMLLLAASFAQDSAPIVLTNHGVCHGKASDAPGCITLPRVTHDRGPDYPEEERQLRHHGTVILQVVVGPQV
jgi:hypothetical protein